MLEVLFLKHSHVRAEASQDFGEVPPAPFYHQTHGRVEVFNPFDRRPQIFQEIESHVPHKKVVVGVAVGGLTIGLITYALVSFAAGKRVPI